MSLKYIPRAFRACPKAVSHRSYSTSSNPSTPLTSPFAPRHLLSIADLSAPELITLVRNAHSHKQSMKSGSIPKSILGALTGKTVAITFSKRSTRTRVSTEGAVTAFGGHPMFLGRDDIQLGVNESLLDTAVVISSMVSAIVARVGPHSDVADLAKHSSVPVINALSDLYHPMQTIADYLTIHEAFPSRPKERLLVPGLGLEGLKIAWVGDANNVLYDLAIGAAKLGVHVAVATPKGYGIPTAMRKIIEQSGEGANAATLTETNVPEEALKDADVVVTDTWISMGQEQEKAQRLEAFKGFQVTSELVARGGAKPGWKFMHCLPRHPDEVSDDVFYSPRSLVFPEAENRLWAAIAVLEAFVVNKGNFVDL
ncbi:ornithine carbamoyltransferase [Pseudocyphellaria aurata]|nr:ornithine carbamoyltransferase [Pseudocyphellaria aurata]